MRWAWLSIVLAIAALTAGASAEAAGPPRIGPIGGATTPTPAPAPSAKAPPLTAKLSTTRPGATRVVLTLRLQTALICGEPGPAPLVVRLPKAAKIPAKLSRLAVVVAGRMPATIRVHGRQVTVSPGRSPGMTCHSITIGTLVIRFTHLAQLENPHSPGRYAVVVRRGTAHYSTKVQISA
jgi:hypothetical protein